MKKNNRDFKGVWIPKCIWESKELSLMEKIFYIEIDSLDNEAHCFASNGHFSKFFGVSKSRCSQIIKSLEGKELVKISYIFGENKNIEKRIIESKGTTEGVFKKLKGVCRKLKDSNTYINNSSLLRKDKFKLDENNSVDDQEKWNEVVSNSLRSFSTTLTENSLRSLSVTNGYFEFVVSNNEVVQNKNIDSNTVASGSACASPSAKQIGFINSNTVASGSADASPSDNQVESNQNQLPENNINLNQTKTVASGSADASPSAKNLKCKKTPRKCIGTPRRKSQDHTLHKNNVVDSSEARQTTLNENEGHSMGQDKIDASATSESPKRKRVAPMRETTLKPKTKRKKVDDLKLPDPPKLSREEIQLVNKTKELITHWNGKVIQSGIKDKNLCKHVADPVKGGKRFCHIKKQIAVYCGKGITCDDIKDTLAIYFAFIAQKYAGKKIPGLYVSLADFLRFTLPFKKHIAEIRSPFAAETSMFEMIRSIGKTKAEALENLSSKFGGASMQDKHPEYTRAFIKRFIETTGRKHLTDQEKGDFIRVSEFFANFCDKHKNRLQLSVISNYSPIPLIKIAFDLQGNKLDTQSYWFKKASFWDTEFKNGLKQRGYLT